MIKMTSEIMYPDSYSSLRLLGFVEPTFSDLESSGKCDLHGYFTLIKENVVIVLDNNIRVLRHICPRCKLRGD